MRHGWQSVVAVIAVGSTLASCTWVSQNDYEEVRDQLDEDGDGTPFKFDCDDQDELRGDFAEVPYDAVDNDCSLKEGITTEPADVDADGDTFPGISQEDYEALAGDLKTPLEYPAAFVGKPLDCADDDKTVFPRDDDDDEVWYDGIDQNCDRANDFDRDHDGFNAVLTERGIAIQDADLQAYIDLYGITADEVAAWGPGGAGGPQPGDCEDAFEEYHPGIAGDQPYNGRDEDCDGQDEYDQDNDGHLAPGYLQAWRTYRALYFLTTPQDDDVLDDDCADGPDVPVVQGIAYEPLLDLVTAATVYPGAADVPYDGIDSDCLADDDFDQDVDGYIPDEYLDERDAMVAAWGYDGEDWADAPIGDCDDSSPPSPPGPSFLIHPGVLDVLFDGRDEDCDGLVDLSYFNFGDGPNTISGESCLTGGNGQICWQGPSNPEILYFDNEFGVYGAAQTFSAPNASPPQFEERAGAVLRFDEANAVGAAEPDIVDGRSWLRVFQPGALQVLATSLDLTMDTSPGGMPCTTSPQSGDTCHYIVLGGNEQPGGDGELNSAVIHLSSNAYLALPRTVGTIGVPLESLDTDAASLEDPTEDIGILVQCGPEGLHGKYSNEIGQYTDTTIVADTCFFYTDPESVTAPLVEVCAAGVCTVYRFDPPSSFLAVGAIPMTGENWLWGDREQAHTLLVDTSGDAFVRDDPTSEVGAPPSGRRVFFGEAMSNFDLDVIGTTWYAVGITDEAQPRVLLEIIESTDPLPQNVQRQELDVEDLSNPDWVPTGVAIAVADGKIAVAVTREDLTAASPRPGNIGWTFLGMP